MSDIVERLRIDVRPGELDWQAADTIEALRAENARLKDVVRENDAAFIRVSKENARLREALRPFAYALKSEQNPVYAVNIDDFRAALAALENGDD